MKSKTLFAILTLALVFASHVVLAQDAVEVTVQWAACSQQDGDGHPLAPAVSYEVYVQQDYGTESLITTVQGDTTCTLEFTPGVIHRVRVVGRDSRHRASPTSEWSDPVYFDAERSSEQPPEAPRLPPNVPNPFNPETSIAYGVPSTISESDVVMLEIYNLHGQRIRQFAVDRTPGWHQVQWNGTNDMGAPQATGLYLTRYVCGEFMQTRKMMMVK